MDRLYQIAVFVAVAERECFALAAQDLKISASAVSRTIAALEQELGVLLIRRNTRNLDITPAGLQYLQDARAVLNAVARAEREVGGMGDAAHASVLTVRSPTMFGTIHLAPMIAEFNRSFPATRMQVQFDDGPWNDLLEQVDLQIYIGEPPSHVEHAQQIGSVGRMLCAAPDYLERHPAPATLADLAQHHLVGVSDGMLSRWEYCQGPDRIPMRVRPQLTFANVGAAISATLRGAGITQLLNCQADQWLHTGQLLPTLTQITLPDSPIYLIFSEAARARADACDFADLVALRMRQIPVFNPGALQAADTSRPGAHLGDKQALASLADQAS